MLDDIKSAILRSGYTFPVIARKAGVAHNTIYGLFEPDANPTIGSLERISTALLALPHKSKTTCDGCKHNEGVESFDGDLGVLCRLRSCPADPTGCARYETP